MNQAICRLVALMMVLGALTAFSAPGPVKEAVAEIGGPSDTGNGDPAHDHINQTDGDWIIEPADDLTYQDAVIYLNGNLSVHGKLRLTHVTLIVNTTGNGSNWIRVMDGGKLMIDDSDKDPLTAVDASNITASALDGEHQFNFWVNDTGYLYLGNSTMSGCGFMDAQDNEEYYGLYIRGDGCLVENMDIHDCYAGVIFNGTSGGAFTDSTVMYGMAGGAAIDSTGVEMGNNWFFNQSMVGGYINNSPQTSFHDNEIEASSVGLVLDKAADMNVTKNNFTDIWWAGINVEGGCDNITIYDNIFHNTSSGVRIFDADAIAIVENDMDNSSVGVEGQHSTGVNVTRNHIWDMDQAAVMLDNCSGGIVNTNDFNHTAMGVQTSYTFDYSILDNTFYNHSYGAIFSMKDHSNDIEYNVINDTGAGIVISDAGWGESLDTIYTRYNEVSNTSMGIYGDNSAFISQYDVVRDSGAGFYFNNTIDDPLAYQWVFGANSMNNMLGVVVDNGYQVRLMSSNVTGNFMGVMATNATIIMESSDSTSNMFHGVSLEMGAWAWIFDGDLSGNGDGVWAVNSTAGIKNTTVQDNVYGGVTSVGNDSLVQTINCTVSSGSGTYAGDLQTLEDGYLESLNTTWSSVESTDGEILIANYLHIHVSEEETGVDLPGVDVNITRNQEVVFESPGFGGTDPVTNAAGMIWYIPLDHEVYHYSNTGIPISINITVWDGATDTFWRNSTQDIDMSTSHVEEFVLDKTSPADAPVLTVDGVTESTITISWTASASVDVQDNMVYINETDSTNLIDKDRLDADKYTYTYENLAARTTYYVAVADTDEVPNYGPKSNIASATTTDETPPDPPADLWTDTVTGTSIRLHWGAQFDDDLGGFTVFVSDANVSSGFQLFGNVSKSTLFVDVTGLLSETTYYFWVATFDDFDPANPSIKDDDTEVVSNTTLDITPSLAPMVNAQSSPTNDSTRNIQGFVYKTYDNDTGIGTPESGATVTLYINNQTAGEGDIVEQTGQFSVLVTLSAGMNYIHAVATDDADTPNLSPPSDGVIIILDQEVPAADAGGDIDAMVGDTVMLDGANSTDNYRIMEYLWSFMDDDELMILYSQTGARNVSYTFENPGKYEITLMVADAAGNVGEDIMYVNVTSDDAMQDTDGDGLPDEWEILHGLDLNDPDDGDSDEDDDGLTNLQEYEAGTDPLSPDTDVDGFTDKEELDAGTDPLDVTDMPVLDLTPPEVTSFSPGAGATGVLVTEDITVEFDEAVDPLTFTFTLTGGASTVPGSASFTSDKGSFTWSPDQQLVYGRVYSVKFSIADIAGNYLINETWTFTAEERDVVEPNGTKEEEEPGAFDAIGGTMGLLLIIVLLVVVIVIAAAMAKLRSKKKAMSAGEGAFFKDGEPMGGEEPAPGEGNCPGCGAGLTPGAEFCPECGQVFDRKPMDGPEPPLGAPDDGALAGTGEAALAPPEEKLLTAGDEGAEATAEGEGAEAPAGDEGAEAPPEGEDMGGEEEPAPDEEAAEGMDDAGEPEEPALDEEPAPDEEAASENGAAEEPAAEEEAPAEEKEADDDIGLDDLDLEL